MKQRTEQGNQDRAMSQGNKEPNPNYEERKGLSTVFGRLLAHVFGKSSRLSNLAITCSFASFLTMCALFGAYRATNSLWVSYMAAAFIVLAIVSCVVAFFAQTISQIIRLLSKSTDQGPRVFKEGAPQYAKFFNVFRMKKNKGSNLFKTFKTKACQKVSAIVTYVHSNGRAYHRASRPAFAHASFDSATGSGDSGDSDQGDPPDPSHFTAQIKPLHTFCCIQNSSSHPQRFSQSSTFGCCDMRCRRRSPWRWSQ